jgi:N-acetyl-gamma-glutamyl-phosphate reductase
MPDLLRRGTKVVDLGADFRLRDPAVYARWYGEAHVAPELLERFAYGLPELQRDAIAKADAVASPGCYPTAAALALAPLTAAGVIEPRGIVVDAASGGSGAGRALKHATHFGTANEDFTAYGLLDHRHTPEIEQAVGGAVLFTPHLAPMTRGILATCYARPAAGASTSPDEVLGLLEDAYAGEPFVVVSPASPSTKATWGSNAAHLTARYDPRTGWVLVLAALDNLVKGASGQAVQCANILLGLDETAGLSAIGVYP